MALISTIEVSLNLQHSYSYNWLLPKTQVVGIDVGIGPANQAEIRSVFGKGKDVLFGPIILMFGNKGGRKGKPDVPNSPTTPPPVIVVKLGKSKNDY